MTKCFPSNRTYPLDCSFSTHCPSSLRNSTKVPGANFCRSWRTASMKSVGSVQGDRSAITFSTSEGIHPAKRHLARLEVLAPTSWANNTRRRAPTEADAPRFLAVQQTTCCFSSTSSRCHPTTFWPSRKAALVVGILAPASTGDAKVTARHRNNKGNEFLHVSSPPSSPLTGGESKR